MIRDRMADEHLLNIETPRGVATGTATYYLDRLADFRRRCPDVRPPSYYADYGNKCLGQFLSTQPSLSPRGQRWIDDTLELLQEMMEHQRRTDDLGFARMERDDDAFREFAFGTHSQAYQDAGVFELGLSDLWKIVRTPDLADLLSDDGLKEIVRLVLGREGGNRRDSAAETDSLGTGVLASIARSNQRMRSTISRLLRGDIERPSRSFRSDRSA